MTRQPLSLHHLAFGAQAGWRRTEQTLRRSAGEPDRTRDGNDLAGRLRDDFIGAICETAWWAWQGIWPGPMLVDRWSPDQLDDPRGVDVKGTTYGNARLLVPDRSLELHPSAWYVLVIWQGLNTWLVGGMHGSQLLEPGHHRDWWGTGRPCYGAEQAELTRPEDVLAAIGGSVHARP